jgi:hypothetical protein
MKQFVKVESLVDDKIMKFKPHNGGWGVGFFDTFPKLPACRPSNDCHTIYTLGTPVVVWWAGHEHGRDGYGLAVKTKDDWKAWYHQGSYHSGWLEVSCEQLSEVGIHGVFRARVNKDGLQISLISVTVNEVSGKPENLIPPGVKPHQLSKEEKDILRNLL